MAAPFVYDTLWGNLAPTTLQNNAAPIVLEQAFKATVAGWIIGLRFYMDVNDTNWDFAWYADSLFVARGAAMVSYLDNANVTKPLPGWQQRYFHPRQPLAAGTVVGVRHYSRSGLYYSTPGALVAADIVNGNLTTTKHNSPRPNGRFTTTSGLFPNQNSAGDRYGIDVLFLKK